MSGEVVAGIMAREQGQVHMTLSSLSQAITPSRSLPFKPGSVSAVGELDRFAPNLTHACHGGVKFGGLGASPSERACQAGLEMGWMQRQAFDYASCILVTEK